MSQLKHLFKLVLIIIPLFFISACVKKSENVPMDELRSIVAKNENNYTAVLTATELGKTQKVTIKVDGNYNENGEITSCKIFTNLKGQNDYFDINGKTMTAISYVNGQYIGTKSDFKDPPSMSDLNYFRNLLAQNIDIFSYDANKRTYTGTIDHNLDGKVTMRLSVSGGHLVYFDITMISSIVAKMTFEFSNYGTTKIDLPTYTLQNSGSGDQVVYAEGAGQISNTSWKRIINNLPEMYTLKIEGNDPETGELIRNTIHFDNTTGNLSQRDSKYSYLIENNQALYLQSRGSFWFAMVYDGELTNPLEDLKNKYITSYLDFDYNNAIGGYERYLDNLKVEVQFQKSQLSKIVLINNSNRLEYTVTYDTKSTVYLPTEYELVDELPEMLPTGVTREIWEEICSLNVKSYEAVVHNNSEWNTYVKANRTAFDDSTVYYIEYPHVVHFNEYGSQSETIYYTLIDNQYYKIAKNEYGSYFAEKITKLELPKVDYYEKYITQIRDFDNIKYSWSTYEYIYTTSQYTIYIKASEHNRTLNSIRIVEGDEETTITYRRINSVEPNLPHYQTYYTAPFASKDEWNSATNNIGNNYTLTCTDQMDQVKKTYYFDEINDINYIKIVENEATNYYIKMNNQ